MYSRLIHAFRQRAALGIGPGPLTIGFPLYPHAADLTGDPSSCRPGLLISPAQVPCIAHKGLVLFDLCMGVCFDPLVGSGQGRLVFMGKTLEGGAPKSIHLVPACVFIF